MTAQTDGATIQRNPLLNFMLMCVVWSKAVYLKCVNCAPHLAAGGAKDAEYVATKMIEAIRTLPHPCYVDLIITDGAGDMTKFRGLMVAVLAHRAGDYGLDGSLPAPNQAPGNEAHR